MSFRPLRMTSCLVVTAILIAVVALAAPQQLPVVAYKASLVFLAGWAAYWLDRWVFPYARPDGYLIKPWRDYRGFCPGFVDHEVVDGAQTLFIAACARRAGIMAAAMLAVGLGL